MPPQNFCDHGLQTRASAEGTFRKGAKIGVKCRTPEATLHGTKQALNRTADATGQGVRLVGRQFGHGWKRVKGVLK